MQTRFAAHPEDVKHYDTNKLHEHFVMEGLLEYGKINFIYSHYDRVIAGGAVPGLDPIPLETYESLKADYFLERREMGIINTGGTGSIIVDGTTFELQNKECLYIGRGSKEVFFSSQSEKAPAKFYINSAPAHTSYPTTKKTLAEATPTEMGVRKLPISGPFINLSIRMALKAANW